MKARLVLTAGALLLACGCVRKFIEVTVEPRLDGSCVRTLRLWQEDDEKKGQLLAPDNDVLANAAKHYLERREDEGAAARFQGTFLGTVPPDILHEGETNQGGYTVLRSPLGHAGYYRERRPGRLDVRTRLAEIEASLDLIVQLGITVARQQLEGEAGLDKLVAYLDGPFRRDLKEASLHFYAARLHATGMMEEKVLEGVAALALQFAEERGHVKAKDLPKFSDDAARAELLASLIAQRLERPLDDGLRKKLAFVGGEAHLKAAYEKALPALGKTDEQFQAAIKPFLDCVVAFELFETFPTIRYVLQLPPGAEVRAANGSPDTGKMETAKRLTWQVTLRPRPVAGLFYALWVAPEAEWQQQHLGRVALRGEGLLNFLTWESTLDAPRLKAWHAALDRLDPKGNLEEQLKAIHLAPRAIDAPEEAPPEQGATVLLEALKPPPEPKAEGKKE